MFAFVAFGIRFREQTYRVSRVEDARATLVINQINQIKPRRKIDPSNNPIRGALRRTGDEITLAFVRFERQRAIRRGNGERDGDKGGQTTERRWLQLCLCARDARSGGSRRLRARRDRGFRDVRDALCDEFNHFVTCARWVVRVESRSEVYPRALRTKTPSLRARDQGLGPERRRRIKRGQRENKNNLPLNHCNSEPDAGGSMEET